ncbi:MAG: hypothetical protein NTU81_01730 [Candidatus Nomurabacteria bacterium]|nr:hypothetical protein [Candidatus Nomurabacteria bacterium]
MERFINILDLITIITSVATLIALGFTIHQSNLTKRALLETKKSIEQDKINRQLSLLPEVGWVIQVRVELEQWQKELEDKNLKLKEYLLKKDINILKELSSTTINKPGDLRLSKFQYDKMPVWLSEIWLSGAQYYYDAIASTSSPYIDTDEKVRFSLIEMLSKRCEENIFSIKELLKYLSDMIPEVILETPASVSNHEFFKS